MTRMAYYQKTWRLFYSLIYGGPKVSRQFQFTHGRCKKINGIGMSGGGGEGGGVFRSQKMNYFEDILSNWGLIALSPKYGPHLGIHNNSSQFKNLGKCRRLQYIMCVVFHLTEGKSFYEEKDEKESWGHEEEDFDNRHFVDVEDNVCIKVGRHNDEEQDKLTMDTASSRKTEEEENLENMEKKLKTLEELFSSVPTVLIKRVLSRDDVKGDLNKARQTLQEFQGMENSQDLIKPPTNNQPIAWGAPEELARPENKKGSIEITELHNYQEGESK